MLDFTTSMDVTDRRSAEHVFVFFILSNINKLQAIKKITEIRKWSCISNTNRDTDSTSVTVSENGSCHLIFHSRHLLMSIYNADNLYSYTLNYFAQICENGHEILNSFRDVEIQPARMTKISSMRRSSKAFYKFGTRKLSRCRSIKW